MPFVRSPMGRGVLPDEHPLSAGGAHAGAAAGRRDLPDGRALQLDLPFRPAAALRQGRQVIQLDIAPGEIGHNKPTEVALVGDGKTIMTQINKALVNRQWFHPSDTPWRMALTKKATENAATIKAADRRLGAGRLLPCAARRRRLDA